MKKSLSLAMLFSLAISAATIAQQQIPLSKPLSQAVWNHNGKDTIWTSKFVGIRTSSPDALLHVNGEILADSIRIKKILRIGDSTFSFVPNYFDGSFFSDQIRSTNGRIVLGKGDSVSAPSFSDIQVGIGNESPGFTLDVSENININPGALNNGYRINGVTVLHKPSGSSNIGVGEYAGFFTMGGLNNSFFGDYSGYYNDDGLNNSFLGAFAGYNNLGGFNNSFIGYQTGYSNTYGWQNVFLGSYAGYNNDSGYHNIFIGEEAGWNNTSGYRNVFIGNNTGHFNTTGNYNTYLGYFANTSSTLSLTNATAIGANSLVEADNSMVLGSITPAVNVGIGTTVPAERLHVVGNMRSSVLASTGTSSVTVANDEGMVVANTDGTMDKKLDFINDSTKYMRSDGTWDVPPSINDADADPNNELNTFFTLTGTTLGITDAGGTLNADLSSLAGGGADADWYKVLLPPNQPPSNINDYMYHLGRVAIGTTGLLNPTTKLWVHNNNQETSAIYGESKGQISPFGIWGDVPSTQFFGIGVLGTAFSVSNTNTIIGVRGEAGGISATNIGVDAIAQGFANVNIAVNAQSGNGTTNYGIYATSPDIAGYFNGKVTVTGTFSNPSDSNLKTNVTPIANALALVEQLNPETFYYDTVQHLNMNFSSEKQYGLSAQEVETILPEIVTENTHPAVYDSTGNQITPPVTYKGVDYTKLVPILIKTAQEQQQTIKNQQLAITDLSEQVDSLQSALANQQQNIPDSQITAINIQLASLQNCIDNLPPGLGCSGSAKMGNSGSDDKKGNQNEMSIQVELATKGAILYQNEPNPFGSGTSIRYFIPEIATSAEMIFNDETGREIEKVTIEEKGPGKIEAKTSALASGIYSYSLVVDGKIVGMRKMMRSR